MNYDLWFLFFIYFYLFINNANQEGYFYYEASQTSILFRLNEACGMVSNIKFYNSFLESNVKSEL